MLITPLRPLFAIIGRHYADIRHAITYCWLYWPLPAYAIAIAADISPRHYAI